MPGNAGGEVAAAIGKKRHRGVVVTEIGVARKGAMLFVEHVVDAAVELILVVRLDPGEYIVVRRGGIGRRIVLQYLRRQRVDPVQGDLIVGERHARGGYRIVNRRGERATALCHRGHYGLAGDSGSQPGALPIREEERLVLADGPTHRQAVLVPAKLRTPAGLREIVPGVQVLIAEELKERAVELVAARLSDHHDGSAVGSAVFGRVGVEVQPELLHGVDDGIESYRSE